MTALLDTSLLIALLDPSHTFHATAARWFLDEADNGWATCPITQNGFVRIVSHSSYPGSIPAAEALQVVRQASAHSKHTFWPDDVELSDEALFDDTRLLSSGQVTDTYLLGVAIKHGGRFVTLDRRIEPTTVRGALPSDLVVLKPRVR